MSQKKTKALRKDGVAKKDRRLKIIWNSNAEWSTSGYAQQMAYLLPFLKEDGWNQAMIAFFGLEGGVIDHEGIKTYPKIGDIWGADAVIAHGRDFGADVTFTHQDIWVLDPNAITQFKNWIPFVPIDHDPAPLAVIQRLKAAYRIVTYSKFGQKQLEKNGLHSTYIPLVVDTDIYKPYNKTEARKDFGLPEDIFLFGMVSANKDNPPRKSFQEAMDAFKLFHDKNPKSGMYFHTNVEQQGGFNILEYAKFLGIEDSVYFPPIYDLLYKIDKATMAKVYSSFDILLAPSTNEGFGVPIVEAQSCGVPVITNNWTAMPELIIPGETGELCEVAYKRFTPLGSYIAVPNVESIYKQMEKLYKADRKTMGKKAREFVRENYDMKKIFTEKLVPFLETIQQELYQRSA